MNFNDFGGQLLGKSASERHVAERAVRYVCACADDADDAAELLRALGLLHDPLTRERKR